MIIKSVQSLLKHFKLPDLFIFEVSSTSNLLEPRAHPLASQFLVHPAPPASKLYTNRSFRHATPFIRNNLHFCIHTRSSPCVSGPHHLTTSCCLRHNLLFLIFSFSAHLSPDWSPGYVYPFVFTGRLIVFLSFRFCRVYGRLNMLGF